MCRQGVALVCFHLRLAKMFALRHVAPPAQALTATLRVHSGSERRGSSFFAKHCGVLDDTAMNSAVGRQTVRVLLLTVMSRFQPGRRSVHHHSNQA
jgi:hypothetical protein